jgi:plasmid maintenance system antidote protein VapI
MTNFYDTILTEDLLKQQFVELGKTSRQIAREFHASRKVINHLLVEYGMIKKSSLEPGDLP